MDKEHNLLVLPEGQRTPAGRLGHFMRGIGVINAGLAAPIAPTRIDGLYELRQRGRFFAFPGEIAIGFGPIVSYASGIPAAEITKDLERLTRDIPPARHSE